MKKKLLVALFFVGGVIISFGISIFITYTVGRFFFGVFGPTNCPPVPRTLEERLYYPVGCGMGNPNQPIVFPYDFLMVLAAVIFAGLVILFTYLDFKYFKSVK